MAPTTTAQTKRSDASTLAAPTFVTEILRKILASRAPKIRLPYL